jgi:hypothetical protein
MLRPIKADEGLSSFTLTAAASPDVLFSERGVA